MIVALLIWLSVCALCVGIIALVAWLGRIQRAREKEEFDRWMNAPVVELTEKLLAELDSPNAPRGQSKPGDRSEI
jgi:hypothetical protein